MNKSPLSDKQQDFLAYSDHAFNIAWGPVSCGKTFIQILKWYHFITNIAPKNCLLLMTGKSIDALYNNVVRDLIRISNGVLEYIHSPAHIRYAKKNIKIVCLGADNEADYKRVTGISVEGWLADEITIAPHSFVQMAIKSCRPGVKPKYWTCNPDHPEHFVKTDYIENPNLDVRSWFFTFDDNPTMSDEAIAELKASFSGLMYQRYILGQWVGFQGQVFDNWSDATHMVPWFDPPGYWDKWLSIDFGYVPPKHAFVCQWWCKVPPGVMPELLADRRLIGPYYIMYREIYTANKTYDVCAKMIKEYCKNERYQAVFADHDIEGIETLRKYGVPMVQKCTKGDIEEKPQVLYKALNLNHIYFMKNARVNTPDPVLKEHRMPCSTPEEFPRAQWETDRSGNVIRQIIAKNQGGDHGIDATYYFLNSISRGAGSGFSFKIG